MMEPDAMKNVEFFAISNDEDLEEIQELYDAVWDIFKERNSRLDKAYIALVAMVDYLTAMSLTNPDQIKEVMNFNDNNTTKSKEE